MVLLKLGGRRRRRGVVTFGEGGVFDEARCGAFELGKGFFCWRFYFLYEKILLAIGFFGYAQEFDERTKVWEGNGVWIRVVL